MPENRLKSPNFDSGMHSNMGLFDITQKECDWKRKSSVNNFGPKSDQHFKCIPHLWVWGNVKVNKTNRNQIKWAGPSKINVTFLSVELYKPLSLDQHLTTFTHKNKNYLATTTKKWTLLTCDYVFICSSVSQWYDPLHYYLCLHVFEKLYYSATDLICQRCKARWLT